MVLRLMFEYNAPKNQDYKLERLYSWLLKFSYNMEFQKLFGLGYYNGLNIKDRNSKQYLSHKYLIY